MRIQPAVPGAIGSPGLVFLIVAIVAAVAVVHRPALSARALSADDSQYLINNFRVRHPSWASAGCFITEVLTPSTVGGYYQPLAMISLMVDCAMGGSPENLRPFHRTSLALHAANTALIFLLLYLLFDNPWAAGLVSLLFGLHPITVEPIPWVAERKTLLATFFALLALIGYVRYARGGRRGWYGLALAAFLLSLASKPTTTPLPLLLLLMDCWPLNRISLGFPDPQSISLKRAMLEKIPFVLVACVFAAITYLSQKNTAGVYDPGSISPGRIPLMVCHNIVFYPWKILWPLHLSTFYPFPAPMSLAEPMVLAGVIFTALLVPLLLISLRWTRGLLAGWLFFFLAILPTMGIIGFTRVIASDKYAYFPAIGLLMMLTAVLAWLWTKPWPRAVTVMIVLAVCLLEARATQRQLGRWQDSETLARYTVERAPQAAVPHNYLGMVLSSRGAMDEAIQHFEQAVQLDPRYAEGHNNLAGALVGRGRLDEAIRHYRLALQLAPRYAHAHCNLATALAQQRKVDEAVAEYDEALRIRPAYPEARYNLAIALESLGRTDEAIEQCRAALRLSPDLAEAHNHLGFMLAAKGKLDEAVMHCAAAVGIRPDYAEAHVNLATALANQGKLNEAIGHYAQALKIGPASPELHCSTALALANLGRIDEAVAHWSAALQLNPGNAEAHNNLAGALASQNRLSEAVHHYREAIRIAPAQAVSHFGLARVLQQQGQTAEAAEEYQRGARLSPQSPGAPNR